VDDVAEYYSAPATVDACHAREFNEGLTKADQNYNLIVDNQGRICLVASKTILPGEALLIRYCFQHWMHAKLLLPLLEAMFVDYTVIVNREGNKDKSDDEDGH
jgi:uncharacterized membrane protein